VRNGCQGVGIACTWPLAGVFGRCLASLRVVGHSRRSRWSAWVRTSILRFPVPQRYGDCRCVSRPAAAVGWQVSACCVTHPGAEQRIRRLLTLPGQLSLQHAARQLGTRHAILASQVRHTGPKPFTTRPWPLGEWLRSIRPRSLAKTCWRTTATTASFPEAVQENEEVVPVNVSTWVLPSGVTVGR
jgi:hypothetical protein